MPAFALLPRLRVSTGCIKTGTRPSMNRNSTRLTILLGTLGAVLAFGGCTKKVQTAPLFATRVIVATAQRKTVPINLTAIGSADAFSTVSIKAQVNAILQEVHIKE